METSDARLVKRCLKGDARAWESVVRDLKGKVYNMAYRYTRRFDVAEELTQDIFLKVFQNLNSYRPGSGPLRNWVMRVGRNLIIDRYRATRHEKNVAGSEELEQVDFHVETGTRNPFESVYLREKAEFLTSGLESLTTELREAVTLRDIEGLAYLEIAQLLEIPEGTVKSRINRGRIELARILRKLRPSEEAYT